MPEAHASCRGRRWPLGVVDVVRGESRPARALIRSGPHQQADPLHVVLLAERRSNMSACSCKCAARSGPATSAVEVRPECRLRPQLAIGSRERIVGDWDAEAVQRGCGNPWTWRRAGRLPDLLRNRATLRLVSRLRLVQPSGFTKADQILGFSERERIRHRIRPRFTLLVEPLLQSRGSSRMLSR